MAGMENICFWNLIFLKKLLFDHAWCKPCVIKPWIRQVYCTYKIILHLKFKLKMYIYSIWTSLMSSDFWDAKNKPQSSQYVPYKVVLKTSPTLSSWEGYEELTCIRKLFLSDLDPGSIHALLAKSRLLSGCLLVPGWVFLPLAVIGDLSRESCISSRPQKPRGL